MALVNMANVLHKQGYTQNATVLLELAVEIYPGYSLNHFAVTKFPFIACDNFLAFSLEICIP